GKARPTAIDGNKATRSSLIAQRQIAASYQIFATVADGQRTASRRSDGGRDRSRRPSLWPDSVCEPGIVVKFDHGGVRAFLVDDHVKLAAEIRNRHCCRPVFVLIPVLVRIPFPDILLRLGSERMEGSCSDQRGCACHEV